MEYIKLSLLFITATLNSGKAQNFLRCPPLTITDLGNSDIPSSEGIISQAIHFPVQINRFNILCLSSADEMGRYQSASVLVGYFCPRCPDNGIIEEIVEQFTFDCGLPPTSDEKGAVMNSRWSSNNIWRAIPTSSVNFGTETETSCALCEHPTAVISPPSTSYNQNTHCISKLNIKYCGLQY